jgi:hypothetical protein
MGSYYAEWYMRYNLWNYRQAIWDDRRSALPFLLAGS